MSLPLNAFQSVRPRGPAAPSAVPPRSTRGGNVQISLPGSSLHRHPQTMRRSATPAKDKAAPRKGAPT